MCAKQGRQFKYKLNIEARSRRHGRSGKTMSITYSYSGRSHWPLGLRRRSTAARLLRLWVRIPPGAWMSVYCECCVLSCRGLCVGLITRPEESYRLCCVVMCDLETSWMRRPLPTGGLLRQKERNYTLWVCVCSLSYPARSAHAPYCVVFCGLFGRIIHFTLSPKWHDFWGKKFTGLKICLLIFSTNSVWNISHSKKKSAPYDKCT